LLRRFQLYTVQVEPSSIGAALSPIMTSVVSHPPPRLNERLGRRAIRDVFERNGRVHVPSVFPAEVATHIHQVLETETPWQLSLNSGNRNVALPLEQLRLTPAADQALLLDTINRAATEGFQYLFASFPMFDLHMARRLSDHYLVRVCEFLNSNAFLEFARDVTGISDIAVVDAQATLFRPGHFLTSHDDSQAGKERLAAYVLNFTPRWRVDWGGVLQFIDADGHVAEGFTPTFNALNLLRVPQKHCVSYVTPAAQGGRYSITGWLRRS
jgi:SM-20-related protein